MSRSNKTYLRTVRLRVRLAQKDVAFLLGQRTQDGIWRLERQKVRPSVTTLIAYRIIFGVGIETLIPQICRDMERTLIKRARRLIRKLQKQDQTRSLQHRIAALERILDQGSGAKSRRYAKCKAVSAPSSAEKKRGT